MDFSDILSYPSPNDSTRAHIQSTDLHTCQRYLNVCATLINTLSDREIDIRSVHYKYRIERFLRSRSRTTQKFLNTYEQRFPYLSIPKDQVFIYECNGNVRIDLSVPTTSKKTPLRKENLHTSKQQRIEENQVSRQHEAVNKEFRKTKKPRQLKTLSCWTVAIYHPIKVEPAIDTCDITLPSVIPLYWKKQKEKFDPIICDLRTLFYYNEQIGPIECDLRPLFSYISDDVECDYYIAPLFYETICDSFPLGSKHDDRRIETDLVDLLHSIFDYCCVKRAIVIVFAAVGVLLFLLCYACLGVRIFPFESLSGSLPDDSST